MFRNTHNRRGSSTRARKPTSRWRAFCIALVLVLTAESMLQIAPAHAAPPADTIRYRLLARKLKGDATVCIDDDVPIKVRVVSAEQTGNQFDNVQTISGAVVDATMSPGGIGTLSPRLAYTGRGTLAPGEIDYNFHAVKEGSTTITFEGTVLYGAVKNAILRLGKALGIYSQNFFGPRVFNQIEIKVEKCNYKVTSISKWVSTGQVQVKIDATITNCGLIDDGSGKTFKGECSVDWSVSGSQMVDCNGPRSTTTSQATVSGERNEDDLKVKVEIQEANIEFKVHCEGDDGGVIDDGLPVQMKAAPVSFTVPVSGGAGREDQVLQAVETVSGYMVAGVWRVK